MLKHCLLLAFLASDMESSLGQVQPHIASISAIGDSGRCNISNLIYKTTDGGFILQIDASSKPGTGNIDSFCSLNGDHIIFAKYSADGLTREWSKCYGYQGDTVLNFLFPMTDGGNVLGGMYRTGAYGLYLAKHDVQGNIAWSKSYSRNMGGILRDMIHTADGGYLMLGEAYNIDSNVSIHYGGWQYSDIWVLKLDSLGHKQWSNIIGGSHDDKGAKVIESQGDYYIVGTTASTDFDCAGNNGFFDVFVAKLDTEGNTIWSRCYGGSSGESAGSACESGKGGLIIAGGARSGNGHVMSKVNGGGSDSDFWIFEIDSSGGIIWENSFGGIGDEYARSVCKATDGTVWANGFSSVMSGQVYAAYGIPQYSDAFSIHADSVGDFLSSKVLGGSWPDEGMMIYPLTNGGVLAGGYYTKNDGALAGLASYPSFARSAIFLYFIAPWTANVKEASSDKELIQAYPNPASDFITIKATNECRVTILDISGREVFSKTVNKIHKVDVAKWAKGMYMIQASAEKLKQIYWIAIQ